MTTFYQDPFFAALVAMSIAYIGQLIQGLRPYQITIVQAEDTFTPAPAKAQPFGKPRLKSPSALALASQLPDEKTLQRREQIRRTLQRNIQENPPQGSAKASEAFAAELDRILLESRPKSDIETQKTSAF